MRILFVDDELNAHVNFRYHIQGRDDVAKLRCFFTAEEAIDYVKTHTVDCAFMDISLSGNMNGLELAKELKAIQPNIEVAFLTAYDEHTKASYQLGGRAYLTKPYSDQELGDALNLIGRLVQPPSVKMEPISDSNGRIKIRTFGNFDLIVDGRAIIFKTAKAKEALAFLVDQMGSMVSGAQMFFALWESQVYNATTSIYVRRTMRALKDELEDIGLADILVFARNSYSIDMTKVYCDSYALLNGSLKEANLFNGEYMKRYSWGEMTIPVLQRAADKLSHS